ncbi:MULTISPECIES: hypothetical protein [Acinetobacter]|uniref:DUF1311 domain-containing protein n=1 Tax=Acinetobacter indicus TaxID=756892 RepID=A0AAW8Z805_9GAMM|nr:MULTISPECIES: hypothetical protein [Acinetobacter]MDV4317065.1 hypothetical protein [Acinetobacter indicus]
MIKLSAPLLCILVSTLVSANPIQFQQVPIPDFSGVNQLAMQSNQSFQQGFQQLQRTVEQATEAYKRNQYQIELDQLRRQAMYERQRAEYYRNHQYATQQPRTSIFVNSPAIEEGDSFECSINKNGQEVCLVK